MILVLIIYGFRSLTPPPLSAHGVQVKHVQDRPNDPKTILIDIYKGNIKGEEYYGRKTYLSKVQLM
jgi:hypothetical protein